MRKPQRKTTAKNKYITRMDYGNTHGWNVRVPTSEIDKYDSFFYADGIHGGKREALIAARTFRNLEFRARGLEARLNARWRAALGPHSKQGNNTSGIIGVSRVIQWSRHGWEYTGWVGHWRSDGKQRRLQYACGKYTEPGAFMLACIARIDNVGPLTIIDEKARFPITHSQIKKLNKGYRP